MRDGERWCVESEDGQTKLGCYDTEAEAIDRLRQVEAAAADSKDAPRGDHVLRFDVGEKIGKLERTPTGGVKIPARVSRAGVFEYQRGDGSKVRELRRPEQVFHADSMRSLEDAAVTVGHPGGGTRLVTPRSFRTDAVGHVKGGARVEEKRFIGADLVVGDDDTIRRIDAGELVENSSGYSVRIDPTPGVWEGERYDVEQLDIRYNHVALLPRGAGRQGADVSLRLDATAAVSDCGCAGTRTDEEGRKMTADEEKKLRDDLAALTARSDAAERRNKELEAELAPARVDARARERADLLERVRPVLGLNERLDGKSDLEIMGLALAKLDPEVKTKLDTIAEAQRETYLRARFDSEMRHVGRSALASARADALPSHGHRIGHAGSVRDVMRMLENQKS